MIQTAVDKRVYEELLPWLPDKIIDCHAHIGLAEHVGPVAPERFEAIWALEIARSQTWEELADYYRFFFPKQEVSALAFGWVYQEVDIDANNDYVLKGALDPVNKVCALYVTKPEWDASLIEQAMSQGFIGIKPYPDLAPQGLECSIYDFLPHSHLKVIDRLGGVIMLHLPRKGRIADPDNIRELLEISDKYPSIRLIVAHIGRAFCLPTAEKGLSRLVDTNIYFDTAANLNADVFEYAIRTVGLDRILFGSDLPILVMRGVREHVGEKYINYTDGNYSWNNNRKSPEEEAGYTYYIYEELKAIIEAVKRLGLGREGMEKLLYSNSAKLFFG